MKICGNCGAFVEIPRRPQAGGRDRRTLSVTPNQERDPAMNEHEIVRIAVRASMAAVGVALACIMTLFLLAAAMSSDINIPGVRVGDVTQTRSGD